MTSFLLPTPRMLRAFATLAAVVATPAFAQDSTLAAVAPDTPASPSIVQSLPPSLADPGGVRRALGEHGFQIGLKYIGEVLGNMRGGLDRGAIYDGRLRFSLDGDLDKAFGLAGLTLHVNGSQLHGRGLSRYDVDNLLPVSNMEATPSTRLFEAWLQESVADDAIDVRIGQLAADQEFSTRTWARVFINNSFGWPAILGSDLPSGGPAFPLATPGARVAVRPSREVSLLAAVFNGDPAGPQGPFQDSDPQIRNRDGLNFRLRDRPFVIGEIQANSAVAGLPGALKLGAWRHFGSFADQRFGTDFLSLADPASNGAPIQRRGDWGYYALLDQQIYKGGDADPKRSAGVFLRGATAPGDRNLISLYVDAGATFTGLWAARPDDLFGVAAGYARIGRGARDLDRDRAAFNNPFMPIRSGEALIEATYVAQIVPGWTLQPDLQYVAKPGGHIPDPRDPNGVRALRNSLVLGLRTLVRY